jgi:xanthine dehydrogenase YagT iron-sulfur-binding subunit
MQAPDFTLPHEQGTVRLRDLTGQPVILAFSPPGWDPSRSEQLAVYNEIVAQVQPAGAQLLGISLDGIWCDAEFAGAEQLRFPLLRDFDPAGDVARRYGVYGAQALFVIDEAGVIRWRHVLPAGVPLRPAAVLAALRDSQQPATSSDAPPPLQTEPPRTFLAMTRRQFMVTALAASFALTAAPLLTAADRVEAATRKTMSTAAVGPGPVPVTLMVNGSAHRLDIEPRVTLLDALREYIGLTGTKKGCDHGQCGACTVLSNGTRVLSCLTLAITQQGVGITTIEGLAHGDELHPLQEVFVKHDGFQCGYCTPGQIMSALGLLHENHATTDAEIREQMSGNICRCGAYPNIVAAIRDVREQA